MPLGIQRLNAKKSHPNDRITFIKPLKGKDEAIAQDFLERIGAQCLPIMKEHHLSITTLEEYEPNREFVGRNFNGGEIIQLVLRARSGHWLPFKTVQMVMMHELAHCVQMNHSRAFWKVRNLYAEQMRTLWTRGYTGEGMWGRGAQLGTGEFEAGTVAGGEELPEHLCGGTYRSRRRRKRGRKGGGEQSSYQEKKQRRIEKKFGKNGVALGADDDVKAKLEKGKRTQAAPRVAGSNRGRELRAAAALARFDQQRVEETKPQDEEDDTGSESDYEDGEGFDPAADDAVDLDGKKLRDTKGNRMIKVCEDEDPDDADAANELKELQSSIVSYLTPNKNKSARNSKRETSFGSNETGSSRQMPKQGRVEVAGDQRSSDEIRHPESLAEDAQPRKAETLGADAPTSNGRENTGKGITCGMCSFENEAFTVTCSMCSNVLLPESVPGAWSCQSASCKGSKYLNAGDCGTCGICGQRKDVAV